MDMLLRAAPEQDAMVWRERVCSYRELYDAVAAWSVRLEDVESGSVVALEADFSPDAVAALLALIARGCILVPISSAAEKQRDDFHDVAQVEIVVRDRTIHRTGRTAAHDLYGELRRAGHPGLVLFSSGSTGRSKAAVHDFVPLLEKFAVRRHARRMLAFLLFDHIGGINTLLYVLSNGGCIVTVEDRHPEVVCAAIARYRVEVLPATPTFLHLLLLSDAWRHHDLSSLQLITYGTEVMPEHTLRRIREALPHVELQQTYGLSELGILRSKSRSADSLWVKIGGEGFETRVRDGLLEIRARSAMLGYLNAPSPFTDDGWLRTGDAVETDGDWLRILGRRSELINVGGEKVFPAEVETVLESMPGVVEAAVSGEASAITGQMVVARVSLSTGETVAEFRKRMREFCRERLAPFKIPQKVVLMDGALHGDRYKKIRRAPPS
jgi:long-chain acyl-CoA synthetase